MEIDKYYLCSHKKQLSSKIFNENNLCIITDIRDWSLIYLVALLYVAECSHSLSLFYVNIKMKFIICKNRQTHMCSQQTIWQDTPEGTLRRSHSGVPGVTRRTLRIWLECGVSESLQDKYTLQGTLQQNLETSFF